MSKRDDRKIIEYILKEIEDIEDFADGVSENEFVRDTEKQKAVCLSFQNIGNYSALLSEEFVKEHDRIPWHSVYGFRTIVAHTYHKVDMTIVWEMIKSDIPELKELVLSVL